MKKRETIQPETVYQLEEKIKMLERHTVELEDKLEDIEAHFSNLLVKFGNEIRKTIDDRVDTNIDLIEYKILKKLVDGNMFELKMKTKTKEEK